MFLWLWRESDGEPQEVEKNLLPFVVMTGGAFLASFFPVVVFDAGSFLISLLVAALVFLLLGSLVGFVWQVPSWKLGILGAIPTSLFVLALDDWSLIETLHHYADGIPTLVLPLTCFLLGSAGAGLGSSIAFHQKASKTTH